MAGPRSVPPPATEDIGGADAFREAMSRESGTVGNVINQLDAWGFTVGDTRFSVWSVLVVVLVVVGVIVFARLLGKLSRRVLARVTSLDSSQKLLIEKILSILVWTFAILIGIDLLAIDLTALAVFSGAFGLAIGFGLQKTFGNLIAGIILLMDKSIKPGDVIAIADQAGNETFGQIRRIGIRAVSIITRDEREYLIPNENLMINQVENWSYSSRRVRIQVPVGVAYSSDMDLVQRLLLEAASKVPRVLADPPPSVWLKGFGDNSVDFTIHCWIVDPEMGVGNVRSDVLKNLWDLFKANGVEIPFPQRDVNLRATAEFQQLLSTLAQRTNGKPD
ncbi:MAG: mechanosensitive ion channel domain-containing protein [Alteraurantiacibacter sp.]